MTEMNKQTKGERVVMLDRERHLRLDFSALALAEEKTGRNLMSGAGWKDLNARDYRAIIWAMLVHEDPDLTLEDTGRMMLAGKASDDLTSALWDLYLGEYAVVDDAADRPTETGGANGGLSVVSTSGSTKTTSGV